MTNAIKTAKKNNISYTLAVGYVKVEVYGLNTDHLKNLHYNKVFVVASIFIFGPFRK